MAGLLALAGCQRHEPPEPGTSARIGPIPVLNDCIDPGWAGTLRCQSLAVDGLPDPPQPNLNSVPTSSDDMKAFTRVFLPEDDEIRCFDGTRPAIYVDAPDASSNKWVISVTGGGSCIPGMGGPLGLLDEATDCTLTYESERGEMSTALDPPMKNFNGINDHRERLNPVFAGYNRIRIQKCSYDRFNGRATFEDVSGEYNGIDVTYDAYQQGFRILRLAMDTLLPGLTYTTWSWDAGTRTIIEQQATLPPLADAETILMAGHSGGAHGLIHNIDAIADGLAERGVTADVRALIDANYMPSLENEAAFATDDYGVPLAGDLFSGHLGGNSIASGIESAGVPFSYEAAAHYGDPATPYVAQYTHWNANLDASCLEAHAGEEWRCLDRYHVLHNHVSTPMFIRQDLSDPGQSHTHRGRGHAVDWAFPEVDPMLCGWFDATPCPPAMSVSEHRLRLETQADTFWAEYWNAWETVTDPTIDHANRSTLYLWMPDCSVHAGAYLDESYYGTSIENPGISVYSMRTWLEAFMGAPRTGVKGQRRHGLAGLHGAMVSHCPP